jgi:hypothetical protein
VLFSHVSCSEILIAAHSIPRMIVFSKKNNPSNIMFLEHMVMSHINKECNESNEMILEGIVTLIFLY